MLEKEEFLPANLECIKNGHHFTAQVRKKVHYIEEGGQPVFSTVPHGSLDNLRCPVEGCGSRVEEA
jgi:hypothetical protein